MLDLKSDCATPPIELYGSHIPGIVEQGCWHPKTFDKAVILVIDALRYDFTIPFKRNGQQTTAPHYKDGIPTLYETALTQPGNAILLPFIADPPTTTLQRLKGLTTGSLPTFIDAGSNFAGTTIDEDNLIAQLNTAGKKVVHLGDDTWHGLFPGQFEPNLTKPYDSFNVPDLHTVDNGVIDHLFPLLEPPMAGRWDVVIGHFLGADHVGHNFGPDHPAMTSKLRQYDEVIRRTIKMLAKDTLLVVMGDHGMDSMGNHGGESDDEVEAAIWMYSKQARFGRSNTDHVTPPQTAKERPVAQIDLVPTLALLLGLPIPAGNLGAPIEEAFIGTKGDDRQNVALVNRLTAAQSHRFQEEYALVRKPDAEAVALPTILWSTATQDWEHATSGKRPTADQWRSLAAGFVNYQEQNLAMFRGLWGTFDMVSISMGVTVLLCVLAIVTMYVTSSQDDMVDLHMPLCLHGTSALFGGGVVGLIFATIMPYLGTVRLPAFVGGLSCCVVILLTLRQSSKAMKVPFPATLWSWICFIVVFLLAVGFGSNSFTVWEEEQLLYILAAFGTMILVAMLRLKRDIDRVMGSYHAVAFMVMIRVASFSRICREEQMPYCTPLFYASANSTTSAGWRLAIPWFIGIALPSAIKAYYDRTASYQASAPFWIGVVFRTTLFMVAAVWTLDTAENLQVDSYGISLATWRTVKTYIAQLVLCISAGAGVATFGWQGPLVGVEGIEPSIVSNGAATSQKTPVKKTNGAASAPPTIEDSRPQIVVQGSNNLYGAHFCMLPFTVLMVPLLVLSKPMGQLALFSTTIAILSLLELLHLLRVATPARHDKSDSGGGSPLGPTILALLAQFTYFKTGHQAALASLQWDTAFVALQTIRYPWSPLFVILNTFAGQVLCAAAVPAVVLWRRPLNFGNVSKDLQATAEHSEAAMKRRSTLLTDVAKAQLIHFLVYAAIQLATTIFAAHLRRHLMLYRVFCPRWMLASVGMIIAELAGTFIGVLGVATSQNAVSSLFGW